ncbi:hypothetical protein HYW20_04800 [Candidatus Woesearchaeota archaeon]|nr:hypothetical protein [Candidatus Woesearchaeota archaeon]
MALTKTRFFIVSFTFLFVFIVIFSIAYALLFVAILPFRPPSDFLYNVAEHPLIVIENFE